MVSIEITVFQHPLDDTYLIEVSKMSSEINCFIVHNLRLYQFELHLLLGLGLTRLRCPVQHR
jgi:hypothetical protein